MNTDAKIRRNKHESVRVLRQKAAARIAARENFS